MVSWITFLIFWLWSLDILASILLKVVTFFIILKEKSFCLAATRLKWLSKQDYLMDNCQLSQIYLPFYTHSASYLLTLSGSILSQTWSRNQCKYCLPFDLNQLVETCAVTKPSFDLEGCFLARGMRIISIPVTATTGWQTRLICWFEMRAEFFFQFYISNKQIKRQKQNDSRSIDSWNI